MGVAIFRRKATAEAPFRSYLVIASTEAKLANVHKLPRGPPFLSCRDRLANGIQGTSDEEENRGQFPISGRGQPTARSRRPPISPAFFTGVVARPLCGR